jgi:hypothetical protein
MARWLPIPGFDGYEASDRGNIQSLDRVVKRTGPKGNQQRRKGVLLKVTIQRARHGTGTPYRTVTLYGPDGKRPGQKVGVLVLTAHVGPRPSGLLMRHLNDDSLDDRLENLAWGTYPENGHDAFVNGRLRNRAGEAHHLAKLTEADVRVIRAAAAAGASRKGIAATYGVHKGTIGDVVRRKTWTHLPED